MNRSVGARNPRNAASPLFQRLTRIFSGPLVDYRRQSQRSVKHRAILKYGKKFKSASGQQFKSMKNNPFERLQMEMMMNHHRGQRYYDFEQMEFDPILASALDVYADEMTTSSDLQPLLKIDCANAEISEVLEVLYKSIMNIEFNLFGWCRTMCKYGDFFLYLDIEEDAGVTSVIALPTAEVERLEGEDKYNPNYFQFQWNTGQMTFENWQMAHFRILGNDKFVPYGTSVLDAARRVWRQLTLLEDAMMAYRITRAPERRVFYMDVGNIEPADVEQFMQQAMTSMKRNQVVDAETGRVDLRYNPMSVEEDYFIPVRGNSQTKVENLPGGTYTGDIDDVKYLRDKLFSAIKIPQSYLSRGEGADEDKTTLAQKDIRFARTIQRIQRAAVSELEKIGIIHLYTLGYRGRDLTSFKLSLNNPSKIAELQELEHWRTKFDVAASATEGFFSRRWISEKLLNQSDEEFLRNMREMYYDKMFDAQLEAIASGGEGGDAGGMGDMGDFGDEGVGDEEIGDMEDEAADEEDETLLAAPAKRDDEYTTPGAKGKMYKPETTDKRSMGARKRSQHSSFARELAGGSTRAIYKGKNELSALAKGIFEEMQTIYSSPKSKEAASGAKEEKEILEVGSYMDKLFEGVDLKSVDTTKELMEKKRKLEKGKNEK